MYLWSSRGYVDPMIVKSGGFVTGRATSIPQKVLINVSMSE